MYFGKCLRVMARQRNHGFWDVVHEVDVLNEPLA